MRFIHNGIPSVSEDDISSVSEVLRSGWLTTGPNVEKFEKAFATYVNSSYAVAVSSGTAALELALASLEIEEGEVITTPFSFVATANSILYNNLKPVFVDIKPDTLNINPEKIKEAITPATKAIIIVDYAGQPCEMDQIKEIARQNNLYLIDDAAHAIGAEYKGVRIGSLADLTTFSFHPLKNITSGEGGMITTNNLELYKKILVLRNHGLDKDDKTHGGQWAYNLKSLGRNFRLTDFQCALGVSQLERIDEINSRRKKIARMYREAFFSIPEITVPKVNDSLTHSWHLFTILLNGINRDDFFDKLKEKGVGGNVHYIPIYKFDYYKKLGFGPENFPVTEEVFERIITLPLHLKMSDEEVLKVIEFVEVSIKELKKEWC